MDCDGIVLKNRFVTFSSSNPSVVTVDANGGLSAVGGGKATISVTCANGTSAECAVTVICAKHIYTTENAVQENTVPAKCVEEGTYDSVIYCEICGTEVSRENIVIPATGHTSEKIPAIPATWTTIGYTEGSYCSVCGDTLEEPVETKKIPVFPDTMTMGLTESFIPDYSDPDDIITFSSGNPTVATVNAHTGELLAKKKGTAIITELINDVAVASTTITVGTAASKLTLNISNATIGKGEKFTLEPTIRGVSYCVYWASSDPSIAIVENGTITGQAAGTVKITASTFNGKTASCTVIVKEAIADMVLSDNVLTLGAGQTYNIEPNIYPENAGGTITYTSDNDSVVKVTSAGIITAQKNTGTANVTVSTYNGLKAVISVIVKAAPTKIQLAETKTTIGIGEHYQVCPIIDENAAASFTFKSSSEKVATVDTEGNVIAKSSGTAKITVKAYNGKSASVTITVKKEPTDVILNEKTLMISIGDTAKLTPEIQPATAYCKTFTWSSNNETVATVDEYGNVTPVGLGHATIQVRTYNGLEDTCDVEICPAVNGIDLGLTTVTLSVGQSLELDPVLMPAGAVSDLTYTVDAITMKNKALTISGNKITAAKVTVLPATVTVSTYKHDVKGSIQVNVVPAPTKVAVDATKKTMVTGEVDKIEVISILPEGTLTDLAWVSSNPACVSVEPSVDGKSAKLIAGSQAGTAKITAKTHNGKSASCTVTVAAWPDALTVTMPKIGAGMSVTPTVKAKNSKQYSPRMDELSFEIISGGEYASVDENGAVTANSEAAGQSITLRAICDYNGKYGDVTFKILAAPTTVKLSKTKATVKAGKTLKLTASCNSGALGQYTFESDDPEVATVTAEGIVTAISKGTATITATSQNGISAQCIVTVP